MNTDTQHLYKSRFSVHEQKEKISLWKTVIKKELKHCIHPNHTIIDLGAGSGEFLLACYTKTKIAVDPISPSSLSKDGITVYRSGISDCPKKLYATADIVMLSNVLEHLDSSKEMLMVLTVAKNLLKPQGKIIIIQPVLDLTGWKYWDFLDHTLPITRNRLFEVLRLVHFKIETYIPRFLPYTTKSSFPKKSWLLSLYLSIPWFLRPFAGQVLVIATK